MTGPAGVDALSRGVSRPFARQPFRYSQPVTFGPWQPLAEAASRAPDAPGVVQARGENLLDLPRGKSAMVLYAASADGESLAAFLRGRGAPALHRAAAAGACYVRFATTSTPQAVLARLLGNFTERFGAPPPANRAEPS
jgi:hypothetical protein